MIRRLRSFDSLFELPASASIQELIGFFRSFGDLSGEDTPGPIPNPAVKLVSADGTWGATPWESRSLPKGLFFVPLKRP